MSSIVASTSSLKRKTAPSNKAIKPSKHGRNLNGIRIRLMKAEEIPVVVRIGLEAALEYCKSFEERESVEAFHTRRTARQLRQLTKDCDEGYLQYNRRIWVAVTGTRVIGSIGIKPCAYKRLDDRSVVELYRMCVIPSFRSSGLAQLLLRQAEQHCKSEHIQAIKLTTQTNLVAAIRFYEKMEFSLIKTKSWGAFDLLTYKKTLT